MRPGFRVDRDRAGRDVHDERGIAIVSVLVLLAVVAALGGATVLLARTMNAAQSINAKAERIAQTGRGINTATDSVVQLNDTDEIANSILDTAEPLEGKLAEIVSLAQSIDGLAASINATAGDINSTAGTINSTAGAINSTANGINAEAAEILDVANRIDADVAQINTNLDATIALARAIKGDTGNIVTQARDAHANATCIDNKVQGPESNDGHCA